MSSSRFDLVDDGVQVGGLVNGSAGRGRPLLVCLHGGGYNSGYFDLPGHSLLDRGERNGFKVLALDRLSYGATDAYEGDDVFEANTRVVGSAIGRIWETSADPHCGVIVVGQPIGAVIALLIAAQHPQWPLLGVSVTGIADDPPAEVVGAWTSVPTGVPVTLDEEQRRGMLFGAEGSFDPGVVSLSQELAELAQVRELVEVVELWPDLFRTVAGEIDVPVHLVLTEFEKLWVTGQEAVAGMAARFTNSPRIDSDYFVAVGHNIDHHHLGEALHLEQLAFALRCAVPGSGA